MSDFNEDVKRNNIIERRDRLGLREVMLDSLGKENAPSTYDKGKLPIDSILCSANIEIANVVYFPFEEGASVYIPLMIGIDEVYAFSAIGTPSLKIRVRKLKLKDPRIFRKSLELLKSHYNKYNLYKKVSDVNRITIKYHIH